jgi:hypothetical protein
MTEYNSSLTHRPFRRFLAFMGTANAARQFRMFPVNPILSGQVSAVRVVATFAS